MSNQNNNVLPDLKKQNSLKRSARDKAFIKKDYFLIFFFIFLVFLLITLFVCLLWLKHIEKLLIESSNERYESYQIAEGLRRTSDDLTTMVRLYVVTGEKKYKDYFNEILAIRNGESPRPEKYNQIYWDLVIDSERPRPFGKPISLKQTMIDHGFTLQEFELLRQAQDRSDDLADMEIKAMNAIVGKFDDGSGTYTIVGKPDPELAKRLVFGKEYMETKAQIMAPIQKFFEAVETRTELKTISLENETTKVIIIAIFLSAVSTIVMVVCVFKALTALAKADKANEMLLLNILPLPIATRLKGGEETIADEYQASVLFIDIVKFTDMTAKLGAKKTVQILNKLFDEFDDLTEIYGVEKIKTIGDNYMAVAGVPIPVTDHSIRLADFALAAQKKIDEFNKANNLQISVRMGMTYGTVVAGVIGHKRFIYDLWGDVVNVASRMQSTSLQGEIQITEKMAMMLDEKFIVQKREEEIEVKGKGVMKTYFLKGRKETFILEKTRQKENDQK